jgi:hypothetical protein
MSTATLPVLSRESAAHLVKICTDAVVSIRVRIAAHDARACAGCDRNVRAQTRTITGRVTTIAYERALPAIAQKHVAELEKQAAETQSIVDYYAEPVCAVCDDPSPVSPCAACASEARLAERELFSNEQRESTRLF